MRFPCCKARRVSRSAVTPCNYVKDKFFAWIEAKGLILPDAGSDISGAVATSYKAIISYVFQYLTSQCENL
jgi:hypothetical protein